MSPRLNVAVAFLAGAAVMVSAAMCLPDDTEPVPPVPAVEERPPLPDDTLVCGHEAKPAIDFNERDGWWAYCEPALVD